MKVTGDRLQPGRTRASRGVSLIEMLIYVGILVLVVAAVGSTILALSRVYRAIVSEQQIEEAGHIALERMVREIHGATSIDTAGSTFASTTGTLTLNTIDESQNASTVQFYLLGQTLRMKSGGVDIGPLISSETKITRLSFNSITTAHSSAVKIELTVESGTSTSYRSKNFYSTAVVRGSYLNQ